MRRTAAASCFPFLSVWCLLLPLSSVLRDKLTASQPVKSFQHFMEPESFYRIYNSPPPLPILWLRNEPVIQRVPLLGGSDKSLTRPTSRCRRTKSIVSLNEESVHVPNCKFFLLQKLKGSMRGDVRDFNNVETRAPIKFSFSCKSRCRREFTPFCRKDWRNMHHSMPQSKTGWPGSTCWFLHLWCASSWTTKNSDHPRDYWSNSRANLGRRTDFSQINTWATGHLTWGCWVHHSWRFGHAKTLREVGAEMPERG